MSRSRTDAILGVAAIMLYLLVAGGLLPLVHLLGGGLTPWRVAGVLLLAALLAAPAVFTIDDWLRKKWG
jgi:hypothetical protein